VIYAKAAWNSGSQPNPIARVAATDPDFDFYRAAYTLSWSPDGQRVLFARPFVGESSLRVMNADGSGRRTLFDTKDPDTGIVFPVWSPDGKTIVFTLGRYGSRNPVTPAQLAQVRADGSEFRLLTQGENGSGYPSFSPDGKRLVFRVLGKEQGLRILSMESGKITPLTNEADNFPAWSPRGDHILFTSLRSGDFEMYTIRPDGSDLRQLTQDHGNNAHGRWSPDGKQIVFTSTSSGWKDETRLPSNGIQSNGELVVMRSDGTHRRQLTDDQWEEATTAWLPGE
jgi:Tol biopolymer transport system component